MKFALFATGALAAVTLNKRQADAIVSDVEAIQSATEALTTAIEGFSGVDSAPAILDASAAVQSAIQQGIDTVTATGDLDLLGASSLIEPVQALSGAVTASIDAVIAQQDAITEAGLAGETLSQLTAIQSLATQFSDALVAAVPEGLRDTAEGLAGPIAADLQRGVDAFSNAPPTTTTEGDDDDDSTTTAPPAGTPTDDYSSTTTTDAGSVTSSAYTVRPTVTSAVPSTPIYTGAASHVGAGFGMVAAGLAVLAL